MIVIRQHAYLCRSFDPLHNYRKYKHPHCYCHKPVWRFTHLTICISTCILYKALRWALCHSLFQNIYFICVHNCISSPNPFKTVTCFEHLPSYRRQKCPRWDHGPPWRSVLAAYLVLGPQSQGEGSPADNWGLAWTVHVGPVYQVRPDTLPNAETRRVFTILCGCTYSYDTNAFTISWWYHDDIKLHLQHVWAVTK